MDFELLHDSPSGVLGIARVTDKFTGQVHSHAEDEHYMLLSGIGTLRIGDSTRLFRAGDYAFIPGNTKHAFVSITAQSKLAFRFERGPLESIEYKYFDDYMKPIA